MAEMRLALVLVSVEQEAAYAIIQLRFDPDILVRDPPTIRSVRHRVVGGRQDTSGMSGRTAAPTRCNGVPRRRRPARRHRRARRHRLRIRRRRRAGGHLGGSAAHEEAEGEDEKEPHAPVSHDGSATSASSMAATVFLSSGAAEGANRAATSPSRPMTNFAKFQPMSLPRPPCRRRARSRVVSA